MQKGSRAYLFSARTRFLARHRTNFIRGVAIYGIWMWRVWTNEAEGSRPLRANPTVLSRLTCLSIAPPGDTTPHPSPHLEHEHAVRRAGKPNISRRFFPHIFVARQKPRLRPGEDGYSKNAAERGARRVSLGSAEPSHDELPLPIKNTSRDRCTTVSCGIDCPPRQPNKKNHWREVKYLPGIC